MTDKVAKNAEDVRLIVFACEAGMGSSLMGANQLKKLIKKANLPVDVLHAPVQQVPAAADVILTHKGLAAQAKAKYPAAVVVSFTMFFNDPAVLALVEKLKSGQPIVSEL